MCIIIMSFTQLNVVAPSLVVNRASAVVSVAVNRVPDQTHVAGITGDASKSKITNILSDCVLSSEN